MGISVRLAVDPSRCGTAADAVKWVRAFHPEVSVTLDGRDVVLGSSMHSEVDLRLVWQSAFINERLLEHGGGPRAGVLGELVR